jgi:hypothetical protein
MFRATVVLIALTACDPGVCGDVYISGVVMNPELEQYRQPDGRLKFAERCSIDYGALAEERTDLGMTTIAFSADDPDGGDGYAISGIVLPFASVAFWDAHLTKGATIPIQQLGGSGLHKASDGDTYQLYALTGGTITVLDGPNDHETTTFDGDTHFTETWQLRWSLDYGAHQHWDGEDTVKRTDAPSVGTPAIYPPDPKPM